MPSYRVLSPLRWHAEPGGPERTIHPGEGVLLTDLPDALAAHLVAAGVIELVVAEPSVVPNAGPAEQTGDTPAAPAVDEGTTAPGDEAASAAAPPRRRSAAGRRV